MEMYKAFRMEGLELRSVASLPDGWMSYYRLGRISSAPWGSSYYCFNALGVAVEFVKGGWLGDIEGVEVWRVEAEDVREATDPILNIAELSTGRIWCTREQFFEWYWETGASELPWRFKIPPPDDTWLAKTIKPIERLDRCD